MPNPHPLPDPAAGHDFYHVDTTLVDSDLSILQLYAAMTAYNPVWLRTAFAIRDGFCCAAGLQTIGGFANRPISENLSAGDKLDFFDVRHICARQLVLSSSDRHLEVVVILHLDLPADGMQKLSVVTTVNVHNMLGKIYMLPVKPAHAVIVKNMIDAIPRRTATKEENKTCQ